MNIATVGNKIDTIKVEISYKIIQLFSAGLYSSPNKAFEELVCNSYDAFAKNVSVYVPDDLSAEGSYIWVCDDGEGLNSKELKDLWLIGESLKRKSDERDKKRLQIGQFGIGKLATYVLARKLTYISKKEGRYILATMDYDLIYGDKKSLSIDQREVNEEEANEVLSFYLQDYKDGKPEINLFGNDAKESWTMSILTDLKPKATEISTGRLKWILRTALPNNPDFNLYFNGKKLESSKIDIPITKEWIIGEDDKAAQSFKNSNCYEEDGCFYVDFENIKRINGKFILHKDSLVDGKSAALGRSHGIFLNVRGRLINLDDPLLGMDAFSHGAFNRTRIMINADALDDNITSTREAIKASIPYEQLKDYIKRKFNSEVKAYYFEEANREAEKKTVSYRLSQTSYTTSKRPIYSFIKNFYDDSISNPFLIEKPQSEDKDFLIESYAKDLESGNQVIESVEWETLNLNDPIAKLDVKNKVLKINSVHPYIANYSDSYKNTLPLESIAITEVLTEAHLYELEIDESQINEVMRKRDTTLRELALADRDGIPAVALLLKEAVSNPNGLEEAVYRAFLALGFETIKIAKPGTPDGKADANLGFTPEGKSLSYSLTFDAKSTAKKSIQAATAHLSALKRHQTDYNADYCVEVAIGYEGQDDSESAISKESSMQKVTVMKANDLVKLLLLAAPKQLGLDKLRNLFDTCYTPLEVGKWISDLEKEEIEIPPYYDIIDIIYDLQSNDTELPTVPVVRLELNRRTNSNYSTAQITSYIKVLVGIVPGCISIENTYVGVQNSSETIKSRIAKAINAGVPFEMMKMYANIFDLEEEKK